MALASQSITEPLNCLIPRPRHRPIFSSGTGQRRQAEFRAALGVMFQHVVHPPSFEAGRVNNVLTLYIIESRSISVRQSPCATYQVHSCRKIQLVCMMSGWRPNKSSTVRYAARRTSQKGLANPLGGHFTRVHVRSARFSSE